MTVLELKHASSSSIAVEMTRALGGLTADCGLEYSQVILAGVQRLESALQIRTELSRFQSSTQCLAAFARYKLVANETYARENVVLIRAEKSRVVLIDQFPFATILKEIFPQDFDPGFQIKDFKLGKLQVAGTSSPVALRRLIWVRKDGQAKQSQTAFLTSASTQNSAGTSSGWVSAVYLREGPGAYTIQVLEKPAERGPDAPGNSFTIRGKVHFNLTENIDPFLQPSSAVQSDDPVIRTLSKSIVHGAVSNREKARAIHDWMIKNITYDFDMMAKMDAGKSFEAITGVSPTALLTLKKRSGICAEFSILAAALLRSSGIRAKVVSGQTPRGAHSWSRAWIDNHWIEIDTTWDQGGFGEFYFDTAPDVFIKDHTFETETEL